MGGSLERAKLYALKPDGGFLDDENFDRNGIEVCFNPKEYSLEKSVNWTNEKGRKDAQEATFNDTAPMTLSVVLQFDTYEEGCSVRDKWVRKIEALTLMRKKLEGDVKVLDAQPPMVAFVWGNLFFQGVIEQLSQKYTMFMNDGTPVRAEVSLKIKQSQDSTIDNDAPTKGLGKQSAAQVKTVSVSEGERIDVIAHRALGDASRWPEIAELNDIDDPWNLKAGSLKIPG